MWCHNSTVWRCVGRVPPFRGGVQKSRQQLLRGGGGGGGGGGGALADAVAPTLPRTRSLSGSFGTQRRIAASAAFRGARVLRRSLHTLLFLDRGAQPPPPTRYITTFPRPTSCAAGHFLTTPRHGTASAASGAGVQSFSSTVTRTRRSPVILRASKCESPAWSRTWSSLLLIFL